MVDQVAAATVLTPQAEVQVPPVKALMVVMLRAGRMLRVGAAAVLVQGAIRRVVVVITPALMVV
jgi:hypothetical protein